MAKTIEHKHEPEGTERGPRWVATALADEMESLRKGKRNSEHSALVATALENMLQLTELRLKYWSARSIDPKMPSIPILEGSPIPTPDVVKLMRTDVREAKARLRELRKLLREKGEK